MSEEITETDDKKSRFLSPAEWEQIVAIYEHGQDTMEGLSKKFGISTVAINRGLKKRGVVKGSKAYVYADAVSEVIRDNASEKAKEVNAFKKNMHTYGDYIMQLSIAELKKISEMPDSIDKTKLMQEATKNSANILKTIRDHKYHLYDLYNEKIDDEKIPEIGVAEYTDEEIALIQKEQERIRGYKPVEEDKPSEGILEE